jgi:hypothetical protein
VHGSPSKSIVTRLGRYFYPLTIGGVAIVLLFVLAYLPDRWAVFGLYPLLGLAGGAVVYHGTYRAEGASGYDIDVGLHRTGVYVTSALTIGAVALTNEPLLVAVGLGVGYLLFVRQLFADPTPRLMVPQVTVLFMLSPLTKYLTAGRYIGDGDVLVHTRLVEEILAGGSVAAISGTSYHDFPGLHLLSSTLGSLTGLGSYDGLMLAGLGAFTVVIPAVYLVAVRLTDDRLLALTTAVAVAILDDVSFFASYVFPQSLAIVLLLVLVVLATMAYRRAIQYRVAGVFVVVTVALALTHHLTEILALPVFAVAGLFYAARGKSYARNLVRSPPFALFAVGVAVIGVRLWQTGFLERLYPKAVTLVESGLLGGYTESVSLGFGRAVRSSSVSSALGWLLSPYGVFAILLLLLFAIGVVGFLRSRTHPAPYATVVWTGILGGVLILESPLSIKSLIRIRLPWQFVFAFVVGAGILLLCRYAATPSRRVAVLVLLVLATAGSPLVTADDYYGLDPRPTTQTSFSDESFAELRSASVFSGATESPPAVLAQTRRVMNRFGLADLGRVGLRDEQLVLPAGHFLYRTEWRDHKVSFRVRGPDSLYGNSLYVSGEWLDSRVGAGNKVYTAGGTGALWSETDRPFGVAADE